MLGPISIGQNRFFYFYASPAGPGEAVVVSVDASLMLAVAGRGRGGHQTMVAVDPNGATWLGCELRATCRLFLPETDGQRRIANLLHSPPANRKPSPIPGDASLSLPTRVVIGMAPATDSPLGHWSVALIASATEIDAREEQLVLQLLLTSAGVLVTVLGVGFFIVRQRAAAAALGARLQAAQEIVNLRERSERILENVPAGILGVTADGRVVMANRFFVERLQQNDQRANGEGPAWVQRLRPHIERALSSKRTQILTDHDVGVGRKELRDYDLRVIPLAQPADDVAALIVVEDLSELHELQRQLVRAEKLVTVGVLSAGIAHEVGTPLAVIRGRAEHLLEGMEEGALAQALRAIVDQIDHISSTIRQVLEFCRTDPIAIGVADVRSCVANAVKLLEWRLAKKCITVRERLDHALPFIAADPRQFEQMVINLLMNACDASPDGGLIEVVGEVDRVRGDRLRFAVIDHGSGISPDNLHAVFDPYFTTKKRGEGTGLGLAIVAQIARLHRGEVTLASAPGAGTTATVSWPLAVPAEESAIA
jgi:signal transduction histidine kinase